MEFNEMINNVLYVVLTAILPIIIYYLRSLVKSKIAESNIIKELTKNENDQKLVLDAINQVLDAVAYVNQVYVDALKDKGEFTDEAQDEAFKKAYNQALNMISMGSKVVIEELYGSFDKWLRQKIEVSVNTKKKK